MPPSRPRRSPSPVAALAAILGLVLVPLSAVPVGAEWQGEIAIDDGTTRVTNPETPAHGETAVELQELWRVGGADGDVLFGVIAELLHDDAGSIYLLDGQLSEIQVFDRDGTYLRTVGREGEGPGEFRNGADMFWGPGGELAVVQAWPGKIVMLTRDGIPAGEYRPPFRGGGGLQSVTRGAGAAGRAVLAGTAWTNDDGQQLQVSYLSAYGPDAEELATYHSVTGEQRFGNWEFQEERFADFKRRWAAAPDGRVAAAIPFADYRIHVWLADGTLDRVIERPGYEPVRRDGDEKKRMQTMYDAFTSWNPNSTFKVADVHETVTQMAFRDDGSLWVLSSRDAWRRDDDGTFTAFDVYDREGRYVRRIRLVGVHDPVQDGVFFAGDRIYVVTDLFSALMTAIGGDEEQEWDEEPQPVSVVAYRFPPAEDVAGTR